MMPSIIKHLHFEKTNVSFRKRLRLFFIVGVMVLLLGCVKAAIHYYGLEFLELNRLLTSGIAGAIFIIGFLLSSVLADYREAEAILPTIRTAIEAIDGDLESFAVENPDFNFEECRGILIGIINKLRRGLGPDKGHSDIPPALDEVARLTPIFGRLAKMGMASDWVIRLRTKQDVIRNAMLRIYQFQRLKFVPSVHVLVQTLVLWIVAMLLFLKTEDAPAAAIMIGFITYMFIYAMYLVRLLEQPFAKGHDSLDDVSFFLLNELESKLRSGVGQNAVSPHSGN
ncbi:MAG: hypothetical protein J0H27_07055 [Xanthomonadales bacterium]|nr:hypothetical protein [Xanthomonadales bacterium]ODU73611.1 MAG: hypothetical protein ABT17_11400 [Rhodanobacter sp. SCN 69-32]OJY84066.1 MAG: hypothetical protein BGP23_15950 [Xanthomonadales bacterium 66-474]HKZ09408.1 hypothetical protein [Rhodanobacteraceae bacterium]